jgi:hypothetical protein
MASIVMEKCVLLALYEQLDHPRCCRIRHLASLFGCIRCRAVVWLHTATNCCELDNSKDATA